MPPRWAEALARHPSLLVALNAAISAALILSFFTFFNISLTSSNLPVLLREMNQLDVLPNGHPWQLRATTGNDFDALFVMQDHPLMREWTNHSKRSKTTATTTSSSQDSVKRREEEVPPPKSIISVLVMVDGGMSPDHQHVRHTVQQRLEEGLRVALLGGAPWMMLVGGADDCEVAYHALMQMRINNIFPEWRIEELRRGPQRLARYLAHALNESATVAEWLSSSAMALPPTSLALAWARSFDLVPLTNPLTAASSRHHSGDEDDRVRPASPLAYPTPAPRFMYVDGLPMILPGVLSLAAMDEPTQVSRASALIHLLASGVEEQQRETTHRGAATDHHTKKMNAEEQHKDGYTPAVVVVGAVGDQLRLRLVLERAMKRANASLRATGAHASSQTSHQHAGDDVGWGSSIYSVHAPRYATSTHMGYGECLSFSCFHALAKKMSEEVELNGHASPLIRRVGGMAHYIYVWYAIVMDHVHSRLATHAIVNTEFLQSVVRLFQNADRGLMEVDLLT